MAVKALHCTPRPREALAAAKTSGAASRRNVEKRIKQRIQDLEDARRKQPNVNAILRQGSTN